MQELQSNWMFIRTFEITLLDLTSNETFVYINHFCQELRRFIMEHGLEDVLQEEPTSVAEVRMKIPSMSSGGN